MSSYARNLAILASEERSQIQPLSLNSSTHISKYKAKELSSDFEDSTHPSTPIIDPVAQTKNFNKRKLTLEFEKATLDNIANYEKKSSDTLISQLANEIRNIIQQDEFIDGEMSRSELYMEEICTNNSPDYVLKALMQVYSSNLLNPHILEGILVMITCLPYEAVEPQGQIMAMGLLSNKELEIRDRAIQCFERWNSKKGIPILKSLACHPKWLQNYVEKVITYLERDGTN